MTTEKLKRAKNLEAAISSLRENLNLIYKICDAKEIMVVGHNPKIQEAVKTIMPERGVVPPIYVSGHSKKVLYDALVANDKKLLEQFQNEFENL